MKRYRKIVIVILLLLAIFAFASLVTGAEYLQILLLGGLPLGNVLTAVGLCSASWAAYLLAEGQGVFRCIALVALVVSLVWLPVSITLAGNLALNFSGDLGSVWLVVSACLLLSVLFILFVAIIYSVVTWYRRVRAA
jgi:hypothetical protein